jgi:penicillin amidase
MRTAKRMAPVLLVLACLSPSGRELPGERVALPGLQAAVEILIDRHGVPHLYARNRDDLFRAQGWNAARDRLWQLDLWKRRGEGRLAEVLGPAYVEQDRAARLLLYRGDLFTEWLVYGPDTKRIVTAFTEGVNAYIALCEREPARLPPEFSALDYRPLRWDPETVVRIRSHGLWGNALRELDRALLLRDHGREALQASEVLEPPVSITIPEGLDLRVLSHDALRDYRLGTRSVRMDEEPAPPAGSNNWAVAPRRTATGRALLANDPHRAQSVPSLRYLVHLSAPGLDVIGAGEPALPGISIGHNGAVAFGLTIFRIDQEDLYVYRTPRDRPDHYLYQGRFEPMRVIEEEIGVRGAEPVRVELRFTRHGPVLHADARRRSAIALRAAWLEPGMAPYLGSLLFLRARDAKELRRALDHWGAPGENHVMADLRGEIGWQAAGRAPIRPGWDGLLPVPGDGRYEWAGFRGADSLPGLENPAEGFVATANAMNLPPGDADPPSYQWADPFRSERIHEVLRSDPAHSIDAALALQTDLLSIPARSLLGWLASFDAGDDPRVRSALARLEGWDARLSAGSAPAALFELWFRRHLGLALLRQTGFNDEARTALGVLPARVRLRLVERPGPPLGPDPVRARDAAVRESLASAWDELRARLGGDPSEGTWGELHQVELRHPFEALLPEPLRSQSRVGPAPRGGSADTVNNTAYREAEPDLRQVSGASFRMVIDVGAWDRSLAVNSPGQSGDPLSTHYQDLFPLWASDGAFPLLYSRRRVVEAAERRIVLEPPTAGPP